MAVRVFLRSMVFALVFCVVMQPAVYAQQGASAQAQQEPQAQAETAAQPDNSAQDSPGPNNSAQDSVQIRAQLRQIGKGSPVIVSFEDGTAQAGKIKKLGDENFALSEGDKGTGTYMYSSVSSVSRPQGSSSNMGSKVVPIAFVGVALVVVAGMVGFALTKSRTGSATAAVVPAK